jgi:FixJ family two-component response regulator
MTTNRLVSLVDDDQSIRESLPELLRSIGLEVRPFASAEEFLASGCLEPSGCLVLDVAMPGMSGPELQQELARLGADVGIVFITAHDDERIRIQALQRGAAAFLLKPFTETAIVEAVTGVLAH